MPEEEPTVATAMVLLVQEPPPVVLPSVTEEPGHTVAVPVMEAGIAFTVTGVVVLQLADKE